MPAIKKCYKHIPIEILIVFVIASPLTNHDLRSVVVDVIAAVIGLFICLLIVGVIGTVFASIVVFFFYTIKWRRAMYKVAKNMTLDEYNFLCKNQSDFKITMPKHLELL